MGSHGAKRVLLADDDAWLRPLVAEMLTDEGYEVVEADSGTQALCRIGEQRPDLVVLDVNLPQCSGVDVLEALRSEERTRTLPVFLVSGCVNLDESGYASRAQAAFHKPLDLQLFLGQLARSLRPAS
jgi:CheY-like chemotaxis protein